VSARGVDEAVEVGVEDGAVAVALTGVSKGLSDDWREVRAGWRELSPVFPALETGGCGLTRRGRLAPDCALDMMAQTRTALPRAMMRVKYLLFILIRILSGSRQRFKTRQMLGESLYGNMWMPPAFVRFAFMKAIL
jgi:hypothetical protein